MSSPAPGAQHDRVASEPGWARELNERHGPPALEPGEPLEEPLWETVKRVALTPRAGMVALGRDVDAGRKGVLVSVTYGLAAAVIAAGQAAFGYPPDTDLTAGVLFALAVLPLFVLGTLLSAYVLRLAIPEGLDRRLGTAFGRLSLAWFVPSSVLLITGIVDIALLASGLVNAQQLSNFYLDSDRIALLLGVVSLWPLGVTAVAIRVATERNWFIVVLLLVVTTLVAAMPSLLLIPLAS